MVSIDPYEQEPTTVSIDAGTDVYQDKSVDPVVATTRAYKAQLAIPELGLGYNEIYDNMINGKEGLMRDHAAVSKDINKNNIRNDYVKTVAASNNIPLTDENVAAIASTVSDLNKPTDPLTVFEQYYGREYINYLDKMAQWNPDGTSYQAAQEVPGIVTRDKQMGADLIAKREFMLTLAQDLQKEIGDQSWFSYGVDFAFNMFSAYKEMKQRGFLENVGWFKGLGLGNNLQEQAIARISQPFDQFKDKLTQDIDLLRRSNPQLALEYLTSMMGQSTEEQVLNNILPLISIPTSVVGGAIASKVGLINFNRKAVKDAVEAVAGPDASMAKMADGVGEAGEAAILNTTSNLLDTIKGVADPIAQARQALPSFFKGIKLDEPSKLGNEVANRINESMMGKTDLFMKAVQERSAVERIPEAVSTERGLRVIKDLIKDAYPHLRGTVHHVDDPVYDNLTNTYNIPVYLSKNSGELFSRFNEAQNAARAWNIPQYEIKQQGNGVRLKINLSLNETDDAIRDLFGTTAESKSPDSWLSAAIGRWRTPEENFAREHNMMRKTATAGTSVLMKVMAENAKELSNLKSWALPGTKKGAKWNHLSRAIEAMGEMPDPRTGVRGGYLPDGLGEFEDIFFRTNKYMPDEQQAHAYFTHKWMMESDKALRAINEYRDLHRTGAMSYRFYTNDNTGKRVYTPEVYGEAKKEFPGGTGNVLVISNKLGMEEVYSLGHIPQRRIASKARPGEFFTEEGDKILKTTVLEDFREGVKDGRYTLVKLSRSNERPFQSFGQKVGRTNIDYVLIDKGGVELKPLSWNNLNTHRLRNINEYDYPLAIKQAKIYNEKVGDVETNNYEGDATIAVGHVHSMLDNYGQKIEQVRQLLAKNQVAAAKKYVNDNMPQSWAEVHDWFKWRKGPNGENIPPRLNTKEPIQVVPQGRLIGDIDNNLKTRYGDTFKDRTREGTLQRLQDAYEIYTIRDEGTLHNPLYKVAPAQRIDPLTSMNRGLTQMVNSTYMRDYKIYSIEHWIEEAKNFLKASPEEIRASPYHHFYYPQYIDASSGQARQLEAKRWQIKQLIGTPDTTDSLLHSGAQKLADSIYRKVGPKGLLLDPEWAIPLLKDPFRYARAITFHSAMGFWSVPQLFVQAQTFNMINAIAGPQFAAPGTKAMMLYAYSKLNRNPEILNWLDKVASTKAIPGTYGYKPGEFLEAMQALDKSGWANVGREIAMRDDWYSANIVHTKFGQVLDSGTWFFKKGEQATRVGAYFTAYAEHRSANPTGRLTRADERAILQRADDLTQNMTRASSSALHTGVFSLPTQFLTYNLRLAEQFLGKRTTWADRARILGWSALVYGAPTAVGVTGLPMADYFRQKAIENGYVVGDNWYSTMLNEGLPGLMSSITLGKVYNVGDRFGANGFETIREALRGDKTFLDMVGGAAFSKMSSTWERVDGFMSMVGSLIRQDGKFPFSVHDFVDVFKEISTVSATTKLIAALNTGRVISKNETYIGDATVMDSVLKFVTGLSTQKEADANIINFSLKDQQKAWDEGEKRFIREWGRALGSMRDRNFEQATKYFARAKYNLDIVGFPMDRLGSAMAKASEAARVPLTDKLEWNFFIKKVPAELRDTRTEQFIRVLRQRGEQ